MPEIDVETSTTDILDATQNAVIDAVNSVSQMLEKTTEESTFTSTMTAQHEPFYGSAEFWVGIAFVLVVIVLFKPLLKAAKTFLIKRRENIIKELDDASNILKESQKLLATYERQLLNTQQEAQEIIKKTEEELSLYRKEQTDALEAALQKKQDEANKAIQNSIETITDEINAAISFRTLEIVKKELTQRLDAPKRSKLIDASISNILKNL